MDHQRLHFLDGLRIGALGLLIVYHVGMAYTRWDWHVKSAFAADVAPALEPWMQLSSPWRMSLLFAVSGAVTALLLMRDGATGGLGARLRRLGAPLLFGIVFVVPPQSYVEVLDKTPWRGSYPEFWALYLQGHGGFCAPGGGCLVVPTWNHLWFLPYLMVYTALFAASLRLAPGWPDRMATRLAPRLQHGGGLVLLLPWALLAGLRLLLRPWFGITHALVDDALAHAMYLPVFVAGVLAARTPGAWPAFERLRWPALGLLLAAGLVALALPQAPLPLLRAGFALQQWCGVVAAIGFAHRHLQHGGPWRRTLSTWVFPVYVLHQTVTVLGVVMLRPLAWPPAAEAGGLIALTLAGSVLGAALLGRVAPLRRWIGLPPAWPRATG